MGTSRQSKNVSYAKKGEWKYVSDPKMKGAFGETDFGKKRIRVNKKLSKRAAKMKKGVHKKYGMSKKETSVINTLVHERMHAQHPRMHERTVRRNTRRKVARMGRRAKQRLYSLV